MGDASLHPRHRSLRRNVADAFAMDTISNRNAEFWNELCGSSIARHLGITDHSRRELERFDQYYFAFYPYLLHHVPTALMRGKKVMEVGLGYGTLGQKIAEDGADYLGLDIADGPVKMMNHRLEMLGLKGRAVLGNILDCPVESESLDWVVAIGCFHHTGDIQRCIDETYRVLKVGGEVSVMVYNRFSYRQWVLERETLSAKLADLGVPIGRPVAVSESMRKRYDTDSSGAAAPETRFSSIKELRRMFSRYSHVAFYRENCRDLRIPKTTLAIPRAWLLSTLGRRFGTDIYVRARK